MPYFKLRQCPPATEDPPPTPDRVAFSETQNPLKGDPNHEDRIDVDAIVPQFQGRRRRPAGRGPRAPVGDPATCRNCARDRLFQRLRPGALPDHPAWVRARDGVLEWRSQRLSTTAGFSPPSATTRVVAGPRTLARVWATSPLARWTVIRSRPLPRRSSAAIRQSAFTATICGNRPDHSRRRDPSSP